MHKQRLALLTVPVLMALNIYAQGDVIFDNFQGPPIHNFRTGADVTTADGIVVQLYASSSGNFCTFMPVPNSIVQVGVIADGFFEGGRVRIPASIIGPGAGAFLEVRGWESAYGATFEEMACAANMNGRPAQWFRSQVFRVEATGNPLTSPAQAPVYLGDLLPALGVPVGAFGPRLEFASSNTTAQCSGPAGGVVNYTVLVKNLCGPTPTVSCEPPSGSIFPLGVSYVMCTISEGTLTGPYFFTVTVEDPTALTIERQASSVIIGWRQTCQAYVLEQTESLVTPIQWTPVTPHTTSDVTSSISLPISALSQFYRLRF